MRRLRRRALGSRPWRDEEQTSRLCVMQHPYLVRLDQNTNIPDACARMPLTLSRPNIRTTQTITAKNIQEIALRRLSASKQPDSLGITLKFTLTGNFFYCSASNGSLLKKNHSQPRTLQLKGDERARLLVDGHAFLSATMWPMNIQVVATLRNGSCNEVFIFGFLIFNVAWN